MRKPFLYILSDHIHHRGRIVVPIIAVKAGAVFSPVRKLYVDGRVARLHQHQVQNQPSGSPVAIDKWMNDELPLELDHIDGNHFNNELINLQIICPNCHSQKTRKERSKI